MTVWGPPWAAWDPVSKQTKGLIQSFPAVFPRKLSGACTELEFPYPPAPLSASMCVYQHVKVSMHFHVHECQYLHVYLHVWRYPCIFMHMNVSIEVCVFTCRGVHAFSCTWVSTYMCVSSRVEKSVHFHVHELVSRISHSNPKLTDSVALASQLAPGILFPAFQSLEQSPKKTCQLGAG